MINKNWTLRNLIYGGAWYWHAKTGVNTARRDVWPLKKKQKKINANNVIKADFGYRTALAA